MVTNPGTRDWTVTASHVRHAQRDVRQPHGLRHRPRRLGPAHARAAAGDTWPTLRECDRRDPRARPTAARSSYQRHGSCRFPWVARRRARGVGGRVRPEGAGADRRGRRRLHPAARRPRHRRVDDRGGARRGREQAGRDPTAITICVAAPAYVGDDLAHQRDQCRWFGGMVGNHVADIVARYGDDGARCPQALTDYIEGRKGYDYAEHGRAGNTHTDFVPDEIIDRFCILGPVEAHIERLQELRGARRRPVRRLPPARRQGATRSRRTASTSSPRSPHSERSSPSAMDVGLSRRIRGTIFRCDRPTSIGAGARDGTWEARGGQRGVRDAGWRLPCWVGRRETATPARHSAPPASASAGGASPSSTHAIRIATAAPGRSSRPACPRWSGPARRPRW